MGSRRINAWLATVALAATVMVGGYPAGSAAAATTAPSIAVAATTAPDNHATAAGGSAYWLVGADGGLFAFGGAPFYGSMGGSHLNSPVVGMAATPSGQGYWLVGADGGLFAFGDAGFYGSMGGSHLNSPVVAMATTPDGDGYWLVGADGGIFAFGDAGFYGSMGGSHLNQPIVGMAPTPDGRGYWLVASDGGLFAFGDAGFYGSMGGSHLNSPVVGMTTTPGGQGYWLVGADGGIFAFGDAGFSGSMGGSHLNSPVVSMAATADGQGYWLVGADGGIFAFGDAGFSGSMGGSHLNSPVVSMADRPSAPTTPLRVCGNATLLDGPSTPPAGAVVVPAGSTLPSVVGRYPQGNTTFWLAPGTFTLGTNQYSQVIPATGDTFIGAPGAVINGQGINDFAFTQQAPNVTIEYLTIENFLAPQSQGVINGDSGSNWTVAHDTVQDNPDGAGVMLGSGDVLSYNCLTENGQYGFQSYSASGPQHVTVVDNEISDNDTANYEASQPGCGCTGGAKFWQTNGAVVVGNYVHDNASVGLWADTDNVGFDFADNYIADNYGQGIVYEISYNARIADNTLIGNAIGAGSADSANLDGAVYISESGSDPRVAGPYDQSFQITGNVLDDNWEGLVLYENSNRFCGAPDNSSSGYCTLVDPSQVNLSTCTQANLQGATPDQQPVDYYDDCRWKTQNLSVTGNTFELDPAAIGADCTTANGCGLQVLCSQYGGDTNEPWSPYIADAIPQAITRSQNNHFADNTYTGPWLFDVYEQGTNVSFPTWQATWGQDAGSTFSG